MDTAQQVSDYEQQAMLSAHTVCFNPDWYDIAELQSHLVVERELAGQHRVAVVDYFNPSAAKVGDFVQTDRGVEQITDLRVWAVDCDGKPVDIWYWTSGRTWHIAAKEELLAIDCG